MPAPNAIAPDKLARLIALPGSPRILDLRDELRRTDRGRVERLLDDEGLELHRILQRAALQVLEAARHTREHGFLSERELALLQRLHDRLEALGLRLDGVAERRELTCLGHMEAGGDEAAVKKFKEVSGAYDILGDKEKRAKFDRGEIDEQGNPRGFDPRQGGGGFGGGGNASGG